MFSGDKSTREKSLEKLKYSSGIQLVLSIAIFVLAIIAVSKLGDNYLNYFVGGFTCGTLGMIAGCMGLYTIHKSSSIRDDDMSSFQAQLSCTLCAQTVLGYVLFMLSISGLMMCIIFLAIGYDSEDSGQKIHYNLAIGILIGIILLLVATLYTFSAFGTCCNSPGYNQRWNQTANQTMVTTQFQNTSAPQTTPVFTTGGYGYPTQQTNFGTQQSNFGQPTQQTNYGFRQDLLGPQPSAPPPPYSY